MERFLPPLPDDFRIPDTVAGSLQAIDHFLRDLAPADVQQELWELLRKAFASPETDGWDYIRRSNAIHLYEQLARLVHSLPALMTMLPGAFVPAAARSADRLGVLPE